MADLMHETVVLGQQFTGLLVEDLSRAHIAQYAGASGDFNLVHVDEVFATTQAGRDAVIAHGMLTMGLTATFATSLLGSENLRTFGGRFLAPVGPGDTLTCVAAVVALDAPDGITLKLETSNSSGVVVFSGEAVSRRLQ